MPSTPTIASGAVADGNGVPAIKRFISRGQAGPRPSDVLALRRSRAQPASEARLPERDAVRVVRQRLRHPETHWAYSADAGACNRRRMTATSCSISSLARVRPATRSCSRTPRMVGNRRFIAINFPSRPGSATTTSSCPTSRAPASWLPSRTSGARGVTVVPARRKQLPRRHRSGTDRPVRSQRIDALRRRRTGQRHRGRGAAQGGRLARRTMDRHDGRRRRRSSRPAAWPLC